MDESLRDTDVIKASRSPGQNILIYARKSDYMDEILTALLETIHYIAAKQTGERGCPQVHNIFLERWVIDELRKTKQLDGPQYCFCDDT